MDSVTGAMLLRAAPSVNSDPGLRSASGVRGNAAQFWFDAGLRPAGMPGAQTGGLQFAGGPIKAEGRFEAVLAGQGAKDFKLRRAGLFIRQHGLKTRRRGGSHKKK
jgi:hypothetical protein